MELQEKEWFIQAPWGRISIIAWGNCFDPPVLLCHGQTDSAVSFRPLLKLLPRNFYYIGMEIPGNGKSDPFPRGLMINAYDLVYAIHAVVKHFRWKQFVYISHSLGTLLGKLYNLAYPGHISKVIDLEPTPVYSAINPEDFAAWYHRFFTNYYNKYEKFNGTKDTAPLYTKEQAIELLKRNRGLTEETANATLSRLSDTVEGKRIRFTFDQRTKLITHPPFSATLRQKFFTSIQTPTLSIVADNSVKYGYYDKVPCSLDETLYPARNYRVREVNGNHDVHVIHPERLAQYVEAFLLYGLEGLDKKAKL